MASCEKLLAKAINSPNNLRFTDLCKLAECYGWIPRPRNATSHAIYINPKLGNDAGSLMNFQNRNGQAKPKQVKQLLEAIEELG